MQVIRQNTPQKAKKPLTQQRAHASPVLQDTNITADNKFCTRFCTMAGWYVMRQCRRLTRCSVAWCTLTPLYHCMGQKRYTSVHQSHTLNITHKYCIYISSTSIYFHLPIRQVMFGLVPWLHKSLMENSALTGVWALFFHQELVQSYYS